LLKMSVLLLSLALGLQSPDQVTLHLKNGRTVTGELLEETETHYKIRTRGGVRRYEKAKVERIERIGAGDASKRVPADLQKKIDRALDAGVAALEAQLKAKPPPAAFGAGSQILAKYALFKGCAKPGPESAKLLEEARKEMAAGNAKAGSGPYIDGVTAMFLSEFDDAESKAALQRIADRIAAAQLKNGSWDYSLAAGARESQSDNISTLQYALLGLQAALNRGCKVDPQVWERAARYLLDSQEKTSNVTGEVPLGWGYMELGRKTTPWPDLSVHPYGAMTAVGVASLAMCRSNLDRTHALQPRFAPAIRNGVAWLARNFSVDRHPGVKESWVKWGSTDRTFLFYYLYSMERAGVFASAWKFGPHDWYRLGAEQLISTQKPDGGWDGDVSGKGVTQEPTIVATSFAVLFLSRSSEGFIATEPVAPPKKD
jgi:hypothetical protein